MNLEKFYQVQTENIKKCIKYDSDNQFNIACRIAYIDRTQAYLNKGYRNSTEWCKNEFELDRRRVSEYLKVVYRFFLVNDNANYNSVGYTIKDIYKDYSFSKLKLLTDITDNEIKDLEITPEMSWSKIHKIVSEYKKHLFNPNDDTLNTDLMQSESYNHNDYVLKFYQGDCYYSENDHYYSFLEGLEILKEKILHDDNNDYIVVIKEHKTD